MWNKFLALALSVALTFVPFYAFAGEVDPDDSLNINGKVTALGKGERAPYQGILFDIQAATKLKLDKEFAQKNFKLQLDYEKKKISAELTLKLNALQIQHDTLKSKTDTLLVIKNDEINRLQGLIKDSPNDYNNWFFAGGVVAGVLLSIGIFYATVEIRD
tara:strand:+ start:716 stop:1195 length:480 start_codon:yes stop_codon:yes gene_type:complete